MIRIPLVLAGLALGATGTYFATSYVPGRAVSGTGEVPATTYREPSSFRDIVRRVLPAVVSIDAQAKGRRPAADDDEKAQRVGFGSGFLISAKGVVVTNNHVVEGADRVVVQLQSGKKYTAKSVRTDPKTDLAVVTLDTPDALPFLELGDSDGMEIGDRVLAVGAPFGLTGTVTQGIISSKGRSLKMNMYEDFLQTDAAINPGNSGGPLVNLDGKVIGVTSAIKSRSGGFQGIGLAISSNLSRAIAAALIKDGVVKRGYLGVSLDDAREDGAAGVKVKRVYADGPAEKAGIEAGDVILKLNGKAIRDGRDVQTVVAGLPLGKAVTVEVVRDGKTKTLEVTILEQPRTFGTSSRGPGPRDVEKVGTV